MPVRKLAWIAVTIGLAASPAAAQLLGASGGGLGGVARGVPGVLGGITSPASAVFAPNGVVPSARPSLDLPVIGDVGIQRLTASDLLAQRRERMRTLTRTYRHELDVDGVGDPIRRDEIIGIDLSPAALDAARNLGFTIGRVSAPGPLGIAVTILQPPHKVPAAKAIDRLRGIDAQFELNHVYAPAGGPLGPAAVPSAVGGDATGPAIGMVDGGIAGHPVFAAAHIEQRGFAGPVKATGHGTAVASLMIGENGRKFAGAAPGTMLYAADVYGGSPAAGSAEAIVSALGWLAERRVAVVNISLVGPPNRLLEAAITALQRRGVLVVAAVGNDGPAAPPSFPASYAGVVAVTAVDARDHVLFEAGRASHLDFAAPGADMAAATTGDRFATVRGTSFAAPLVAARLARVGGGTPSARIDVVAAAAKPSPNTGRGIVCGDCRTAPRSVGIQRD